MRALVRRPARGIRRHLRTLWESHGGGFYGFVAALVFLYLETVDLAASLASFGGLVAIDLGTVIGWLVENCIDAVTNGISAALWPIEWIDRLGIGLGSGALLLGAYLAFRIVRPGVLRLLEEPEPAALPERVS